MSGEADLQCQECPTKYQWRGSRALTEAAARFKDWRVFRGPTLGGGFIEVVLCPIHAGHIKIERRRKHAVLDGQESFDF